MKLVAKTLYGLEKVLADELTDLGADFVKGANRAVLFEGDNKLLYKANYCLRNALSVLVTFSEFRIRTRDDLIRKGMALEWDHFMNVDDTFAVTAVVKETNLLIPIVKPPL